jgi:hypothetical protein
VAVVFAAAFVGRAPAAAAAAAASTSVVLLTFEGVGDSNPVGNYYNGGGGGPAKDYGVVFGPAALCFVDSDAGGSFTEITNEPSPSTVVEFNGNDEGRAFASVLGGFTWLSFRYMSVADANVTVYGGPNQTGAVLGTARLPEMGRCSGCGDPNGSLGLWGNITLPHFSSVAVSLAFSGTFVLVDDLAFALAPPPTNPPSKAPTSVPTHRPTPIPTRRPTSVPTHRPTPVPPRRPTSVPAKVPAPSPTQAPKTTRRPTKLPAKFPASACRKGRKGNRMQRCMKQKKMKAQRARA